MKLTPEQRRQRQSEGGKNGSKEAKSKAGKKGSKADKSRAGFLSWPVAGRIKRAENLMKSIQKMPQM